MASGKQNAPGNYQCTPEFLDINIYIYIHIYIYIYIYIFLEHTYKCYKLFAPNRDFQLVYVFGDFDVSRFTFEFVGEFRFG